MRPLTYARAADPAVAVALASAGGRYLGGGTNLVDLMRENIERPDALVDVSGISGEISDTPGGGVLIGAGARNTAVASHLGIRRRFPVLAEAIVNGASAQIRNMATVGGNLLQRTRCVYFYDGAAHCNKRTPGAGCDAIGGHNRMHAILGASEHCVATHPSDMCVALAALDASVHVQGVNGVRRIPFLELHRLPGDAPHRETNLAPGELITAVEIAPLPFAARSAYRKVRERASYAFALVSVAAAIEVEGGRITAARLALGGVAHKPWRAEAAEQALIGAPADEAGFAPAAALALDGAVPLRDNGFKVELARRVVVATFLQLSTKETRP